MPQRKTVDEVNHILDLYNSGYSQNKIFKTLGIDRGTIRQIINDPHGYLNKATIKFNLSEINRKSYSFILGVYLGDGCISKTHKPNVFKLRIALDIKYKELNEEVIDALKSFKPSIMEFKLLTSSLTDADSVVWFELLLLILALKDVEVALTLELKLVREVLIAPENALIPAIPNSSNFVWNEPLHSNKFCELLSNLASTDADNWSTVNPAIV